MLKKKGKGKGKEKEKKEGNQSYNSEQTLLPKCINKLKKIKSHGLSSSPGKVESASYT